MIEPFARLVIVLGRRTRSHWKSLDHYVRHRDVVATDPRSVRVRMFPELLLVEHEVSYLDRTGAVSVLHSVGIAVND